MTRVLIFDGPHGPKRFELLHAALTMAGDGKGDRTPATIRKEARLQEALDTISEPNPAAPDGEGRMLKASDNGHLRLTVTQEDFDLLQQYTERTAWNPRISRAVVDLWDFLSAAERIE